MSNSLSRNYHTLCPEAVHAANAARNWHIWGPWAARMYARKRGVNREILALARVLAAAERAGL